MGEEALRDQAHVERLDEVRYWASLILDLTKEVEKLRNERDDALRCLSQEGQYQGRTQVKLELALKECQTDLSKARQDNVELRQKLGLI